MVIEHEPLYSFPSYKNEKVIDLPKKKIYVSNYGGEKLKVIPFSEKEIFSHISKHKISLFYNHNTTSLQDIIINMNINKEIDGIIFINVFYTKKNIKDVLLDHLNSPSVRKEGEFSNTIESVFDGEKKIIIYMNFLVKVDVEDFEKLKTNIGNANIHIVCNLNRNNFGEDNSKEIKSFTFW
jgi:hypothetical protein